MPEYRCPHCPCRFSTKEDYDIHMKTFGEDKVLHLQRFLDAHDERKQRSRFQKI